MAVHAVLEVHDTADGSSAGMLGWTAHRVPSQCSATNPVSDPTAVHEEAEVQDTDAKEVAPPAVGLGAALRVQPVPFQRSTSGTSFWPPSPTPYTMSPTAVHALADVQDTESRVLFSPPTGAVGTTVQVLPFQDSASAAPDGPPNPVAMHAVPLVQDTAIRVPLTLGMGMTVQDMPSQASASVLGSGLRRMPTATHDDRDGQDTADSPPFPTAAVT
jgi:hypothetical protein